MYSGIFRLPVGRRMLMLLYISGRIFARGILYPVDFHLIQDSLRRHTGMCGNDTADLFGKFRGTAVFFCHIFYILPFFHSPADILHCFSGIGSHRNFYGGIRVGNVYAFYLYLSVPGLQNCMVISWLKRRFPQLPGLRKRCPSLRSSRYLWE